jgi:hypothetical protein
MVTTSYNLVGHGNRLHFPWIGFGSSSWPVRTGFVTTSYQGREGFVTASGWTRS